MHEKTPDPYHILGLGVSASQAQIKKQYLKLAKKYHPDIHGDTSYFSDQFSLINQAYSLLSNKTLKTKYDSENIDFFGKKTGKNNKKQAHFDKKYPIFKLKKLKTNTHFRLDIPFIIAAFGDKIKIELENSSKAFLITIPKAAEQDTILKVPKAIKTGLFRKDKDLYLHLNILPYKNLKRKNLDLYMDIPITLSELFSEKKITVPLFGSSIQVKLPKLKTPHSEIRIKHKGLKKGAEIGHLYLNLHLNLPTTPNAELKNFLTEWENKNPYLKR